MHHCTLHSVVQSFSVHCSHSKRNWHVIAEPVNVMHDEIEDVCSNVRREFQLIIFCKLLKTGCRQTARYYMPKRSADTNVAQGETYLSDAFMPDISMRSSLVHFLLKYLVLDIKSILYHMQQYSAWNLHWQLGGYRICLHLNRSFQTEAAAANAASWNILCNTCKCVTYLSWHIFSSIKSRFCASPFSYATRCCCYPATDG